MTTTTEASTEAEVFCRCGAPYYFERNGDVHDRDPDAAAMRRGLRDVLAEFRSAGIGEGQ